MNEMLTTKELAQELKVAPTTIAKWRKIGLPYKRIGEKLIRYDMTEVKQWIDERNKEE